MLMVSCFEDVEKLVAGGQVENLFVEFKRKHDPLSSDAQKGDRQDLGEALSGFSNAAGGSLIIGVSTETVSGTDVASEIVPMPNVAELADKYRSLAREYLAPENDNVEILAIEGQNGAGVIVVHVPVGSKRPYMSLAPNHQKYFRRSHDRFVIMEHYEVEDMFRLKTSPNLDLLLEFKDEGSIGGNPHHGLMFGVANNSRMTAMYPFLSYRWHHGLPTPCKYGLDGNGATLWKKQIAAASEAHTFAAGANEVVHPGQKVFVSKIKIMNFSTPNRPEWAIDTLQPGQVIDLIFEYGCQDMPLKRVVVPFSKSDFLARRVPDPKLSYS